MNVSFIDKPLFDLSTIPSIDAFMHFDPQNSLALDECQTKMLSLGYDRDVLADSLVTYNQQIGNDDVAFGRIEELRKADATAVVTGQQAGMFTGPLYTIFKAITAIKLAKLQQERSGKPVIPIYWNATEDHDMSEVAFCSTPGKTWKAEFETHGVAAESLDLEPVRALTDPFVGEFPEFRRDELRALLETDQDDYGHFSSALMARLFQGTGLVILEPRILRSLATGFLLNVVERRGAIREALSNAARQLADNGLNPSFQAGKGFGLFHIDETGVRRQVLEQEDGFLLADDVVSEGALRQMIQDPGQTFSTGAYLRPVLQSRLLPNVAYIAGPGELRYHLQLREVYEVLGTIMPVIRLRNHATILAVPEQRTFERLGLSNDDLLRPVESFHQSVDLPEEYDAAFRQAQAQLAELAGGLQDQVGGLAGERAIETFKNKAMAELAKVQKRVGKENQRRGEVDNSRIDRLFACIRPGNGPQERKINVFYFLGFYGQELVKSLLETFDPDESRHYVLRPE